MGPKTLNKYSFFYNVVHTFSWGQNLKTNIPSFTMLFTCSHFFPSSSPHRTISWFGCFKWRNSTTSRWAFLFFFHLSPSSLPWSYHHLPHHDHHDCYHNHHLKLERSFFCPFKIFAFYCVSPPSADIFSFVSFCTSFVIPPVNFNLWEYNNPPLSNWSFAQWLWFKLFFACLKDYSKLHNTFTFTIVHHHDHLLHLYFCSLVIFQRQFKFKSLDVFFSSNGTLKYQY